LEKTFDLPGCVVGTLLRLSLNVPASPERRCTEWNAVMQALRLEEDLKSLAINDVLGRKLQDLGLEVRARSPKKNMNPNC
jgi:hypothetical protein